MKTMVFGLAVALMSSACFVLPAAAADDSKTGIYEVTEIYVLPSAMSSGSDNVPGMIARMVKDTQAEDGLLSVKVTQQVGQPNNYTLIEQWNNKAALDKHVAADHTKQFYAKLEGLISGPVYQRVFSVFE